MRRLPAQPMHVLGEYPLLMNQRALTRAIQPVLERGQGDGRNRFDRFGGIQIDGSGRGLNLNYSFNERAKNPMTNVATTLHGIATEALKLPNNEREALIETLVASVVPPSPLHPEWEAEIARRLADIAAGRVALIPGEQVLAEVRALIAGHKLRTLEA